MFNDISLMKPDFTIKCSEIEDFKEIYSIFRDNKITKAYVYTMAYQKSPFQFDFLKQGMSHPDLEGREYQVGERVCRQASHLPGWASTPISDHGNDFYCGVKRLMESNKLPKLFNKNDLVIGVWDISKRLQLLSNVKLTHDIEATEWAEGELCNQYKKMYGYRPPLNYRDPSNSRSYKKGYILESVAAQFEGLYD